MTKYLPRDRSQEKRSCLLSCQQNGLKLTLEEKVFVGAENDVDDRVLDDRPAFEISPQGAFDVKLVESGIGDKLIGLTINIRNRHLLARSLMACMYLVVT